MTKAVRNVMFLCTGNSARSVLAESLLNHLGGNRFRAYSAGSSPAGRVNPFALALLSEKGHPTDGLRSKSWDEFATAGAPEMDLIFTVCGNAAGEPCPVWPGHPVTAHWGVADPAAVTGDDDEKRRAFAITFERMERRIEALLRLSLDTLDETTLRSELKAIGAMSDRDSFDTTGN